ncbi:phospholipase D-like domain-containing protein [Corynebacterium sp. ES2794-CONJ1]|uniref:phospholipase D-like domain-containing protein n=1 Tax=unclassified Corynebacterium TaxID=2624378 RepID=UPI0021671B09|nr:MULTISPECIES: phospholipase D-like domain-containing protein [unclassified Corynebacterium]MCS4490220.1 phospholipase D-like domain-containing protein [Corynebacterium sp. ES2775-CONJ]MCS4532073.1 phospholipase D-like domain-containing protein [Corynebacterium sp. ES2730-CONJ]MCU9519475.1 phospholipase D-like domain-containing protein [Corynebacterium sp. ES2794-CONJ1]
MNLDLGSWQTILLIIDYSIKIIAIGFVPEGRRPSSSTAWLLAILVLPYIGLPLFLLMGSPYINRRRHAVLEEANKRFSQRKHISTVPTLIPELASIVSLNKHLTSMPLATGINYGVHSSFHDSLKRMTKAVDNARESVHVEIYIVAWDEETDAFFQALRRAVERGVTVRLLFDHVGSWKYPGYFSLGKRLDAIGVRWHVMLPLRPWRWRFRRPDLRNHRKILIVDGHRAFLGSQNLIAPHYLLRKNRRDGREWVDIMVEMGGPIVTDINHIFAVDWYLETEELLELPENPAPTPGADHVNIMQLVPSGPGYETEPNLRMFNSIIHQAVDHIVMCSPYFIPDESLLEAVTSACYRGVTVDLLVSEKGDQFMVAHAQSSYYQALLEAGVNIYQYPAPFVLHSKFLLADPLSENSLGVFGSSNMDMRSFGLNYEISVMLTHGDMIEDLHEIAVQYRDASIPLTLDEWNTRSLGRRYIDNIMRLSSALQ